MKTLSSTLLTIGAFPFNALAAVIDLFFCIPIIGRFAKWGWNGFTTLLHIPAGLVEWALMTRGIKPEKKLRLAVVLFSDETEPPMPYTQEVITQLDRMVDLYKDKANIKVISANSSASEKPSKDWITIYKKPASSKMLDVGCNEYAFGQDLWLSGMMFQFTTLTRLFYTNFRRIIGYGSPIAVFIVDNIQDFLGCSIGLLTDYVTISHKKEKGIVSIPHEVGHACNLLHVKDEENLMHPHGCEKGKLTDRQIAIMRASRHVTFI
jgi:hypothetical protein